LGIKVCSKCNYASDNAKLNFCPYDGNALFPIAAIIEQVDKLIKEIDELKKGIPIENKS